MRNPLTRWFYNPLRWRTCPHARQRGIYGDEILARYSDVPKNVL